MFKFGDLVENGWASRDNPNRVSMVLWHRKSKLKTLSRRGTIALYEGDQTIEKFKKVGEVDLTNWTQEIVDKTVFKNDPTEYWWAIYCFERRQWWKANRKGYTADFSEAGWYHYDEAIQIVNDANIHKDRPPEEAMVPVK